MSFHNIRDKYGRFAKKTTAAAPAPRKRAKKVKAAPTTTASVILNGFLIDASGSMSGKQWSVADGFNEIVTQGQADAKKTGIVNKQFVAFFGSSYKVVEKEVTKLFASTKHQDRDGMELADGSTIYSASMGSTALWESTYKLITKLEQELKINSGAKVILTIFTDGEENASLYEWRDGTKIKGIIEQKQKEGWVITFIGAGAQKAMEKVATSVGIFASNTLGYQNSAAGTARVMKKMSASRSNYTTAVADGLDSNIGFFSNE